MMQKCIIPAPMLLLNLVNYFKLLFREAFTHLGLLKPPVAAAAAAAEEEDFHPDGYVLLMDSRCPSLIPVPVQVVTAMIKKNLPVVEYGNFMERWGVDEQGEMMNNRVCTVCLESMEKSDEMRELGKCCHVFHKGCLDRWVNQGRVTCPLCRSTLYPDRIDWTGRAGGS